MLATTIDFVSLLLASLVVGTMFGISGLCLLVAATLRRAWSCEERATLWYQNRNALAARIAAVRLQDFSEIGLSVPHELAVRLAG
jgi:hypothetical protein